MSGTQLLFLELFQSKMTQFVYSYFPFPDCARIFFLHSTVFFTDFTSKFFDSSVTNVKRYLSGLVWYQLESELYMLYGAILQNMYEA